MISPESGSNRWSADCLARVSVAGVSVIVVNDKKETGMTSRVIPLLGGALTALVVASAVWVNLMT